MPLRAPARLLAALAVLAGLLGGGLAVPATAQTGSTTHPTTLAMIMQSRPVAGAPTGARLHEQRGTGTRAASSHRSVVAAAAAAAAATTGEPPDAVPAAPAAPVVAPPLLLGQQPRPPTAAPLSSLPSGPPGRAPPAVAAL